MFASTLTSGSTSAGNSTFLIRLPPAMSDPAASVSDDENQVHGRMPQNMNSAYGCSAFGAVRHDRREDERVDRSSSSGLMNDQKKPSTEPR